jgi:hypothetical protein
MSGFFGTRKSVIEEYRDKVSPRGYKVLFSVVKNYVRDYGYDRIANIDYTFINRRFGDSKLSMNEVVDFLRSVVKVKPPSIKLPGPVFHPSFGPRIEVPPFEPWQCKRILAL